VPEGWEPQLVEFPSPVTGNQGEYLALIMALHWLRAQDVKSATILSDSQLMVRQFNGEYKAKHPRLVQLLQQARQLANTLNITVKWVPREENEAGKCLP